MINNKKGASSEVSRQAFIILPIAILVLLALIFLFAKGFGSPLNKATSCESQNGVWSKAGCDIAVSTPYSLAQNKNDEKDICCVPISGKEKEFDEWKKTVSSASSSGEIKGTETISFDIGGYASKPGSTVQVEAGEDEPVLIVKNMDEGDFCVVTIQAAKLVGNSVVVDELGPKMPPRNQDECLKGTVIDLGEYTFKVHDKEEDREQKGLYMIKVEVYDKHYETEFGPFFSYVKAVESETVDEEQIVKSTNEDTAQVEP